MSTEKGGLYLDYNADVSEMSGFTVTEHQIAVSSEARSDIRMQIHLPGNQTANFGADLSANDVFG